MKMIISSLAAALVALAASAADTYTNPVFYSDWGSPTITTFRGDDGASYGFIYQGWGRYSKDMVNWQDAYRVADDAKSFGDKYALYWPNVNKIGDRYVMYFTCLADGETGGTSVAISVSSAPASHYTLQKNLFTYNEMGVYGTNEPFMMADRSSGAKYLFFSSPGEGIYATELADDGMSLKNGTQKVQIANSAITAPRLCWHDGYYYLFGQAQQASSSGKTTTNIVVGRSATITGPYVDGMGNRLLDGYFHTVMAGNAYFYDPSNLSPILTDDAGDEWVIYNAVQASASHTYPVMLLDRVRWQDGWPRISDGYPSYDPPRAPLIR